jgi:peptide deformylase
MPMSERESETFEATPEAGVDRDEVPEAADAAADEEAGVERELTPEEQARLEEIREKRREALAQVRTFGDPVLKSRASEVTEFGSHLDEEAERMFELMHDALGIGLAATQLGVMRRMLVFQAGPDSEPRAIVNPEIEWVPEDLVTAEEGCLSLPGIAVDVERPLHARVRARGTAGERVLLEASGLEARVLQHEIDHLDGVLILDRTPREQRRGAMRALRNGETFSPEMLEPDAPAEAANGADPGREPEIADGPGAERPD